MHFCSACKGNFHYICLLKDPASTFKMDCTILCDHKAHAKFLKGKTDNNKVSNGSMKLLSLKLIIQDIKGTENVLVDSPDS